MTRTTTARRIGLADIADALRAVCAEQPDRIDRRVRAGLPPRYVEDRQPACLVAAVLSRLGYSVGQLKALDNEFACGAVAEPGVRISESRHPMLRRLPAAGIALLDYVQRVQDRGSPWGKVLDDALSRPRWSCRHPKPWLDEIAGTAA